MTRTRQPPKTLRSDARAALVRPIADRLFFAGEATSLDAFATAHGAHLSGITAVEAVVAVLSRSCAAQEEEPA